MEQRKKVQWADTNTQFIFNFMKHVPCNYLYLISSERAPSVDRRNSGQEIETSTVTTAFTNREGARHLNHARVVFRLNTYVNKCTIFTNRNIICTRLLRKISYETL